MTREELMREIDAAADDHAYSSDTNEYCESSCFKSGALFLADRLIKAETEIETLKHCTMCADVLEKECDQLKEQCATSGEAIIKLIAERDQLKEQLKTAQSEAHVLSVEKNRHEWDKCQTCDQLRARVSKLREALETISEWEYRSTHDTGKTLVEQECENALAEDKEKQNE